MHELHRGRLHSHRHCFFVEARRWLGLELILKVVLGLLVPHMHGLSLADALARRHDNRRLECENDRRLLGRDKQR